ncbi:MAG: PorP/SprF family type IX secretion system membrane protein [Bacteroidales bacterium]|nr:PorP/SprF family type IX secretion system membrane protein [Bacteroidales bacterium]MBN2817653.1 PorP/SprF family type IX secretion system membrane protein [Bacteroidales bacterium]
MKKLTILIAVIIQTIAVFSQQLPEVSYYMYDYTRTNPGSIGSSDMVNVTGIFKNSLMNIPGQPTVSYFEAEMPFNFLGGKHGVGISFYNDIIGFNNDIDLKLGYAFRFSAGDGTFGIGINGGIKQHAFKDGAEWVSAGPIDPANDPRIPDLGSNNLNALSLGVGVFYRTEDIYFGASVLNVYAQDLDYSDVATTTTSAIETLEPHYYATAGYTLQLNNPAFELQPSVNFYSDLSSVTFDVNGMLTYNKRLWGGVSYRASSSAVAMAGLMIMDGLKVGYAYDFQLTALNTYSTGSHEIMLNYSFKLGVEKSPQRYKSIRYL